MKKFFTFITVCLLATINFTSIKAVTIENALKPYEEIIEEINTKYSADLYILSEDEFLQSPISNDYNNCYDNYINNILKVDLEIFKNECLETVQSTSYYDVEVNHIGRSTLGTKTMSFNSSCNSMTLKYKYSGGVYDTSYKPTATVAKLSSTNYFVMSSYTGSFKNSNTTYSVVATGKIYTTVGIVNNRSFTVNFNL